MQARPPRWLSRCSVLLMIMFVGTVPAREVLGHFLIFLPSRDVVDPGPNAEVECLVFFGHPMEQGPPLPVGMPERVGFVRLGAKVDLTHQVRPADQEGSAKWFFSCRLTRPGDYVFFVEGAPYWEGAERQWLVHSAKVVVQFGGAQVGWDREVGLPVEIVPLTRPYGLWVGNCFRGMVLHRGKPVPGARVEVEFWNEGSGVQIPHAVFSSQVVKSDSEGVFCYSIPWAGWWGFVALVEGPPRPGPDGQEAPVELAGAIWVRAVAPPTPSPVAPRSDE